MALKLGSYVLHNAKWIPLCSRVMKMSCRHLHGLAFGPSGQPLYRVVACHSKTLNNSFITQSLLQKQLACLQHGCNKGQYRMMTENKKTTALTLIRDLRHLKSTPPAALVLGLGGVIPFAATPAYIIMSGTFVASFAFSQVAYGACILSFLGGIRWGLTIPEDSGVQPNWFNLGYSVSPSLVAWVGLLLPTPLAILTLIAGLTGSAFMDLTMWGYPPWFRALRFLLSVLAILSLWTTLMCQIILSESKPSQSKKAEKKDKDNKSVRKAVEQDSKSLESSPNEKVTSNETLPLNTKTDITVSEAAEVKDYTDNTVAKSSVNEEEVKEIKD